MTRKFSFISAFEFVSLYVCFIYIEFLSILCCFASILVTRLVIFDGAVQEVDDETQTEHFESIQSTNWLVFSSWHVFKVNPFYFLCVLR